MEIKTYTADNIFKSTRIKPWKRLEGPVSLWDHLGIDLPQADRARIKFAKIPEMVTFENKPGSRYEGWRTAGGSWVTIFALTPDDKVVVVIEYKHGVEEVMINLPAGNFGPGDDRAEAVRREFLEETGFTAKTIEPLGNPEKGVGVSGRQSTARYFGFVGTNLVKTGEPTLDEGEDLEPAYVPLSEWLKMIDQGMIRESSVIVTTFMALRKLGRI